MALTFRYSQFVIGLSALCKVYIALAITSSKVEDVPSSFSRVSKLSTTLPRLVWGIAADLFDWL
jgi:hypothetical protein